MSTEDGYFHGGHGQVDEFHRKMPEADLFVQTLEVQDVTDQAILVRMTDGLE